MQIQVVPDGSLLTKESHFMQAFKSFSVVQLSKST